MKVQPHTPTQNFGDYPPSPRGQFLVVCSFSQCLSYEAEGVTPLASTGYLCFTMYYFFLFRLSLLEEWRGVRDAKLTELSGISGCIFVHANGFIGGNETREGALEMARKTLSKTQKH